MSLRALAGDVSRRMFEDFARALDRASAGEEPEVDVRPPSALSLLAGTVVERVRIRFANRKRWRSRRTRA